jgi:stress response protein SCP2
LKFIKISEQADNLTGEIVARTAQDKKITIKLNKVTENVTEISIRVGMFGDQTISHSLLEEIKRGL